MFNVSQEHREFVRDTNNIRELLAILRGITKKLIPAMDTLYEWARIRDNYMHDVYDCPIDPRTKTAKIRNKKANIEAELLWYDPRFGKNWKLSDEEVEETKARRKMLVDKSNEIAVMVIQFDNVVEEISSVAYDEIFEELSVDSLYKESLARMNIDQELIDNMVHQSRKFRNLFCHTYAFHKVLLDLSIQKIIFSRISIILLNKMALQLSRMYACSVELNEDGLGLRPPNNPSSEVIMKIKWVSLPKEAIRKSFFQ